MTAAALVREARASGTELRLVDGAVKVRGNPSPDLLARLREAKPEIADILRGDRCRSCGAPLAWPRAVGVVFADDEVERLLAAGERAANPDLAADPGETMIRSEAP